MARPSKLTPKLTARMVELIEQPMHAEHAARRCHIGATTYYRWMKEGAAEDAPAELRDFHDRIEEAKAVAADKLLEIVIRNAEGRTRKRYRDGEVIEEWLEADPASARWMLERMHPEQYGNRIKVDVDTEATVQVQFDEEAEALARALVAKASGYDAAA